MNKQQWKESIDRLKQPAVIISLVIALGLITNIYLGISLLIPSFQTNQALKSTKLLLEQQKNAIQQTQMPQKVSDQELLSLAKAVPVKPEQPRLIMNLKDMEKSTGVTLTSIKFGDDKAAEDLLTNALSVITPQQGPASTNGTSTNGGQASPLAATGNGKGNGIQKEKITLQLNGLYANVIDFVKNLQQSERIVSIQDWKLQAGGAVGNSPNTNLTNPTASLQLPTSNSTNVINPEDAKRVQLSLTAYAYSAPAFAGKIKDLPPLEVKSQEKRTDPTASDEEFLQLLDSLNASSKGAK